MGAALPLRRLGTEARSAVPELIAALEDENQHVRFDAVCALGSISPQDEAVLTALIAMLQDASPLVRVRTIKTLAEIAPHSEDAFAAVRSALQDDASRSAKLPRTSWRKWASTCRRSTHPSRAWRHKA